MLWIFDVADTPTVFSAEALLHVFVDNYVVCVYDLERGALALRAVLHLRALFGVVFERLLAVEPPDPVLFGVSHYPLLESYYLVLCVVIAFGKNRDDIGEVSLFLYKFRFFFPDSRRCCEIQYQVHACVYLVRDRLGEIPHYVLPIYLAFPFLEFFHTAYQFLFYKLVPRW